MKFITLDLETYWTRTHSLSKMSPFAYSLHPDTEIITLSYQEGDGEPKTLFGELNTQAWADSQDWSDTALVTHNGIGFDYLITTWRLGIHPKLFCDTLAMARPHHAKTVGGSLKALTAHYGIGHKDSGILTQTQGKHLKDFTRQELVSMALYNKEDARMTWELFKKLLKITPRNELALIDATARMTVYPKFQIDTKLLTSTLEQEQANKGKALMDLAEQLGVCGLDEDDVQDKVRKLLMSSEKFSQILRERGVEPPTKISPNTGKEIPALAKTDQEFLALQEHEDEVVASAATARLGAKSTILETRIKTFLEVASLCDNKMPVPLAYYGATNTGRWSAGVGSTNLQNLPRVDPKRPRLSDALRMSLCAPPGHKVVVVDLSGIELRMNHILWGEPSSTKLFQEDPEKADLYKDFASKLYNVPVDQVTKTMRQMGKAASLGLGFGAGATTFQRVAKTMGGVELSQEESYKIVSTWREAYPCIVSAWRKCDTHLNTMSQGKEIALDPQELCVTTKDGIVLNGGMGTIRYPNLRREMDKETNRTSWVYCDGRHKTTIRGPKVVENMVQALSRYVLSDIMLAYAATPLGVKYPITHIVHDEIVVVVPEVEAEAVLEQINTLMRTPPQWFPALATWSEGKIADRYGLAH